MLAERSRSQQKWKIWSLLYSLRLRSGYGFSRSQLELKRQIMKVTKTLIILILFVGQSYAQPLVDDLVWAKAFKDCGLSSLLIETDSEDNIYVAGVYEEAGFCQPCFIEYEGEIIRTGAQPNSEIFLAKLDSEGELLWSKFIGAEGNTNLSSFEVDNNDELVLYSNNYEEFQFDSKLFKSGSNLFKLNGEGELLWNTNITGPLHYNFSREFTNHTELLSIGGDNEIVIGGSVWTYPDTPGLQIHELSIEGDTFLVDTLNIFIAKFDVDGSLKWVSTFDHNNNLSLSSLDVSINNHINVLGNFSGEDWDVDGTILSIDTSNSKYNRNSYILQLDESGDLIWAKRYFDDLNTKNITHDALGNIIATGAFQPSTYFEQDSISSTGAADDVLLFKTDDSGNYIWGTNAGDRSTNQIGFPVINSKQEIYLSGDLGAHLGAIMHKYDPSGRLEFKLNPSESKNRNGGDLAFDQSGNLIQTGVYYGDFVIGNTTIEYDNAESWSQFILKFANQWNPTSSSNSNISPSDDFVNLSIFPNPTMDELFVNINSEQQNKLDLYLYDSKGQLILEKRKYASAQGVPAFNIEHLSNGAYLLKVISDEQNKSFLVVKI